MIYSRVLIVDGGQVIAEDTPENLTRRLSGGEAIQLEVRGPRSAVTATLQKVPGVTAVQADGTARDGIAVYNVACASGADPREALARAVVEGGFGLLELRQAGMSLEDVFLNLITEESATTAEGAAA